MARKRVIIGFNGALLALFLDICLLISLRSVDELGHFQTNVDKWQRFGVIASLYGGFLMLEVICYVIVKIRQRHLSNQVVVGQG